MTYDYLECFKAIQLWALRQNLFRPDVLLLKFVNTAEIELRTKTFQTEKCTQKIRSELWGYCWKMWPFISSAFGMCTKKKYYEGAVYIFYVVLLVQFSQSAATQLLNKFFLECTYSGNSQLYEYSHLTNKRDFLIKVTLAI